MNKKLMIVTNNPLVAEEMSDKFDIIYRETSYEGILQEIRDLVHRGFQLLTHPLSGSVKPNETPYKSVVVSKVPHKMNADEAAIISNCVEAYDKFTPRNRMLSDKVLGDFQLIDYTLLCGAVDYDAAAGLSKLDNQI